MPGAYLSYPFCAQKCTYCNFASGVLPRDLERRYLDALRAELRGCKWPWVPETVYLGGGTPSRMDPEALRSLLDEIPSQSGSRRWIEATIEAAPGGITRDNANAWRAAGINRVSLGVQSFVQPELARTGRRHTAETVQSETALLRAAGLHNFNIDLIAGLPGQTRASWNASLDWIERIGPPHGSVYMLEVDEDSRLGGEILAFGKRYGAPDVPSDDQIADFYEIAVERLASMGILRYEISNFARPGFESRHNLKYWRREPYLGFGADAHSFDGGLRWRNAETAQEYVERFDGGLPFSMERAPADPRERFFLGLRLQEGINEDWSAFAPAVEDFAQKGLLEIEGRHLRLTPRGILLSNE
ncbi:MAG TPA: radical SAM family heme chaperone HemW, partial [Bryobacteraceae bacterium]|nr:radical SAM family heme chaperone HemW [Bryobacteraceae bacterium]